MESTVSLPDFTYNKANQPEHGLSHSLSFRAWNNLFLTLMDDQFPYLKRCIFSSTWSNVIFHWQKERPAAVLVWQCQEENLVFIHIVTRYIQNTSGLFLLFFFFLQISTFPVVAFKKIMWHFCIYAFIHHIFVKSDNEGWLMNV